MAEYEVVVKRVEPVRVIAASEEVSDFAQIGPTEQRLVPRLEAALESYDGQPTHGPPIAICDFAGGTLRVITGLPVSDGTTISTDDIDTTEFRLIERAATTVISGEPNYDEAFTALQRWVEETGETAVGHNREVYLDCNGPRNTWVLELQVAIA